MTTPQQFGEYLLFRQLTSDALGDTYRAGKIGSQGIERVVLLRLFNGPGIDAESLWRTLADRRSLHNILQNPHIGDGADIGRVGSTPYVAYEYVSGKNLAELLKQARSRAFQIPTEHALFIMERVTFGLSAAYSTRHRDQRIQHGFLVPDMVLLSNEGEVRLVGFESAPGLREFLSAAPLREAFGSYLAQEVKPGSAAASSDDVFSLGSMLFELLTGAQLAPAPDGNFDPQIDEAMLSPENQPLPPSLRALLKSSLAARQQRIGDVQQWQQAFGRYISEADYSPTTFNLAFFMHTLFGGEIEQETLDIAREKATQVDVRALAEAQVQEPVPGPADTVLIPPGQAEEPPPAADEVAAVAGQYGTAAGSKKNNWRVLAPLLLLAVLGGLAAAYFWSRDGGSTADTNLAEPMPPTERVARFREESAAASDALEASLDGLDSEEAPALDVGSDALATDSAPANAVDTTGVEVPPTPEDIEDRISRLVDDRTSQYEDELELLRNQLDEAKLAQEQAAEEEARQAEILAAAQRAAEAEAAATLAQAEAAAASESTAGGDATTPTDPEPAALEAVEAKPPAPPAKLGDLVEPGRGVQRPQLTQRPNPRYPPSAKRLNKQADVVLRILIDETGRVAEVQQLGDKVGFGFDDAARLAAERTRWSPATKDGVRVKMWIDLTISFRP